MISGAGSVASQGKSPRQQGRKRYLYAFSSPQLTTVPITRNLALAAVIVVTLFFLVQSFYTRTREIERSPRQSLQVFSDKSAPSVWHTPSSQVTKVTALFGQTNDLYEAAIRSHDEHNQRHGYEMKVLRERIVNNFWSKPAYLLSVVVEELAKPEGERTEWFMWLSPDMIILNYHIPLEIFLPPEDFKHIHFIGTHDTHGLDSGVFFIRVHEWSVRMLIEILSVPKNDPALESAVDKDQKATELSLTSSTWRDHVVYQPRTWFNAYQLSSTKFEGKSGDLLVHFHDLEGDKWSAMSSTLSEISQRNSTWSVPLGMTAYEVEIREFWDRIRLAQSLLTAYESETSDEKVADSARRLTDALHFEPDDEKVINEATDGLKEALGALKGEKIA